MLFITKKKNSLQIRKEKLTQNFLNSSNPKNHLNNIDLTWYYFHEHAHLQTSIKKSAVNNLCEFL